MTILSKESHQAKAPNPIDVIPSGIEYVLNPLSAGNARILFNDLSNSTPCIEAYLGLSCETIIVSKEEHATNAPSPIEVRLSGRMMLPKESQ